MFSFRLRECIFIGMELVTRAELAKRLGIDASQVWRMINSGVLPIDTVTKKPIWDDSYLKKYGLRTKKKLREREIQKQKIRTAIGRAEAYGETTATPVVSDSVKTANDPDIDVQMQETVTGESDFARLTRAKADSEEQQALLRKYKAEELRGDLLRADKVRVAIQQLAEYVKTSLYASPDRICAELAGMTNPDDIYKTLRREIDDTLKAMADGITKLDI